jgi:hypothetical protein
VVKIVKLLAVNRSKSGVVMVLQRYKIWVGGMTVKLV